MLKIRSAVPEDFEGVYSLICLLEQEKMNREELLSTFLTNCKVDSIYYLVAEENSRIVAFGSMHIQFLLHHGGKAAELQEMIVSDHLTGSGIGRQFLERFREIASLKQCKVFEVCCNQKRLRAHRFYHSHGLIPTHFKFTLPLR